MHERDSAAVGAGTRHVVDQPIPCRAAALERVVEVGNSKTQVMDSGSALGEELRHGAVRVAWLEQLDLDVAQANADHRGAVGRLRGPGLEPEDVPIEGEGRVDRRHGNADMGDAST